MARPALRKEATGGPAADLINRFNERHPNSNTLLVLVEEVMNGNILLIEDATTDYGYRIEYNLSTEATSHQPLTTPSITLLENFDLSPTERSTVPLENPFTISSLSNVPDNISIDFSTIYAPGSCISQIAKSSLLILQKQAEIIESSKKYKSKLPLHTERGFMLISICVLMGYLSDRGDTRAAYFLNTIDEAIAYGSLKADLAETMDKFKDPLSGAIQQLEEEGLFNF
jgi:hypothetical protein